MSTEPVKEKIAAVIATFNEEDHLARALASLKDQGGLKIEPLVVNAGDPLSPELAEQCHEIRVATDCFWTASNAKGIEVALAEGANYVLLLNSDTTLLPNTVPLLLAHVRRFPMSVACSPGYVLDDQGRMRLQYNREVFIPVLVYNFLERDWAYKEDALNDVVPTDLAGGQGVLVPRKVLELEKLDVKGFPHYRADMDLWLRLKGHGVDMVTICQAGVLNNRELSSSAWGTGKSFKRWMWFFFSRYAPESIPTMWRLRRKHVVFPLNVLSFLLMVPTVWLYRLVKAPRSRMAVNSTPIAEAESKS